MSFHHSPDAGVLARLRQATASRHEAIEALLQLDRDAIGLARYRSVLGGFAAFLQGWEPAVRAALPADLRAWFDTRSRLAFLQQDLRALDVTPPRAAAAPVLSGPEEALGSMYVLEGSALGGQLITRAVARTLGLTPQSGAAYFNGWGDRTGVLWKEFRALLEERVPAEGQAAAADAAVRTFDGLLAVFRPLLTPASAAAGSRPA